MCVHTQIDNKGERIKTLDVFLETPKELIVEL